MDPEDLVVEAFGVLLTQVRTARRALEDVQRATSRYLGLEFSKVLTEGPRFGAPPLYQGALMVHIVNINDLAPGNSFGGFLEALFGGIGNFFGNLIGGTIGGLLSSRALPEMIRRLERIVLNVGRIIDRLGIRRRAQPGSTPEQQAQSGATLITTLNGIRGTIRDVTALFQAASSGPGDASGPNQAGRTSTTPLTSTGERWMAILDGVNRALDRTARIVDALIIAIPIVIGSIALLVANLAAIRRALLETIQFILRNALILRGVLLTVIFETVSSAARLAAAIVGILGTAIQGILTSIVGAVQALIGAVFDALQTLTSALQAIVRSLLEWMITGVFNTLRAIGELSVFRTIDHLVRILPSLIPAIYMLMSENNQPLPANVMEMLTTSHQAGFPRPGAAGTGTAPTTVTIGAFPDIAGMLQPLHTTLSAAVTATATQLQTAAEQTFGAAQGVLTGLAGRFDRAVQAEADFSRGVLNRNAPRLRSEAAQLAEAVTAPLAVEGRATGLEEIARAYQDWLTGGGINALLNQIGPHFTRRPAEGEPGGPLRLLRGQFDRPRASIDIDRVEIVIEPPAEGEGDQPQGPPPIHGPGGLNDEQIYLAVVRHAAQLEDRGIRHVAAASIAH
jgi:hypothetical protein